MKWKRQCDGCDGTGVRAPAAPSCSLPARRRPWVVVERCDVCERFASDFEAALSRYRLAGWFQCCAGGWHALADSRSRRQRSDGADRIWTQSQAVHEAPF